MQKITAEDEAIIARFQRGHESAFDELVKRHQRRAYHYAFRLTNDPDEAADVVAEAFVRVYKSIGMFKGESSFTTWLFRIETNCFLDMRKKARSRMALSLDEIYDVSGGASEAHFYDNRFNAHEHVEQAERITTIGNAMEKISGRQRSILMMYHAEGMSYEDIALALKTPIGTVKSRLNRARCNLRQVLRPYRSMFNVARPTRRVIARV